MMKIGKQDIFERHYLAKFRELASRHGEFTVYERDRAARDIGLHLTRKSAGGQERVSSTLCWFQLKGMSAGRLDNATVARSKTISLGLEVRHLQFWYLQSMPTYLAVYVESADRFFVLNIQRYVEEAWGKSIFKLEQETVTVHVPLANVLDDEVFEQILKNGDVSEWSRILQADKETVQLTLRDYNIIHRAATAERRGRQQRVLIWAWQIKTRSEVRFQERSADSTGDWETFHEHWQYMLSPEGVEAEFPYLGFDVPTEEEWEEYDEDEDDEDEDEEEERPVLHLAGGKTVVADSSSLGDVVDIFILRFRLNELGWRMYESAETMAAAGVIELSDDESIMISKAPWHGREL